MKRAMFLLYWFCTTQLDMIETRHLRDNENTVVNTLTNTISFSEENWLLAVIRSIDVIVMSNVVPFFWNKISWRFEFENEL